MENKYKIKKYIESNSNLIQINKRRTRNFIIYNNDRMNVVFDVLSDELLFQSKIPFSDIEHDTNRKFTEQICIEILLDFRNNKDKFIEMLSKPYASRYKSTYKKYIAILNSDIDFTDEDIFVLISILGRLNQQRKMGPISVLSDYKLNPDEISRHVTLKKYIVTCVSTIKEYTSLYLQNKEEMILVGNMSFNGKLDKTNITPNPIPLLAYNKQSNLIVVKSEPKITGGVYAPNYIDSFLRKFTGLSDFDNVPISIDNYKDIMVELTNYGKRFRGNTNHDFIILAKIKGILLTTNFDRIIRLIERKILKVSSKRTYYNIVSEHLLNAGNEDKQKNEFYKLIYIYEKHIASELSLFLSSKSENINSGYNDCDLSIESDMHFNDLKNICKSNYSKNFNIVAGDFYNNTYHRGGIDVTDEFDICGIGVLGNHDVNWMSSIDDIKKEIKTKYKQSINNLNRFFPNIKILNNEVYYKNGFAFVGLTMVTDEEVSAKRLFFANESLGKLFLKEDYLKTTRKLLDSIDRNTPVVVISHSPFKEYAVCKNKKIGIVSERIFSEYPNVRMYIHGHGHSVQKSKVIDNVLCVTNPIVNNIYSNSSLTYEWKTLGYQQEIQAKLLSRLN